MRSEEKLSSKYIVVLPTLTVSRLLNITTIIMRSLIFIHIPKTAGTAFFRAVRKDIAKYKFVGPKGIKRFILSAYNGPIFVKGHFPYGYHVYKPFRSFDYITFLRHPIERAVSHYHFVLESKDEDYTHPHWARHHNTPLKDMFNGPYLEDLNALQPNVQTRMIAGLKYRKVTDDKKLLEAAKFNLEHRIKAFGIQDDFDRSMQLFAETFNWQPQPNRDEVWKQTKSKTQLDDATTLALENGHQLDLELYAFAKKLFEQMV